MADGSSKPISEINVNDELFNAVPDHKKGQNRRVDGVIVTTTDRDLVDLTIASPAGVATVTTTSHHLFWNPAGHKWIEAGDLAGGDLVQTTHANALRIVRVRRYAATVRTYDLTVAQLHTYFVLAGSAPVLVHNCPVEVSKGRWDHIWRRHVNGNEYQGKSKFATKSKAKVRKMINRALDGQTADGVYAYHFQSAIGTTAGGRPQYYISVVVRHGKVITAFPSDGL
jgi:hypothetical protein